MNKIFYIFVLIVFSSCLSDKSKSSYKENDPLTAEEKTLIQTFAQLDSLLKVDNAKFWGKQLYGPTLFVQPETRIFYANENGYDGTFEKVKSMFKDTLPTGINISNTAMQWNNKRWSMVMLPLPVDKISRCNLIIHELFHRIQPELGFGNIKELDNGHLDTFNGRLLLKLELQALKQALLASSKENKLKNIKNALIFRNQRHANKDIKNAENSLELNEGIAEYTAVMLSGRNGESMKNHLIQSKNIFFENPSFIRSFEYETIPTYGYLLSSEKPNWHKEISEETNLTDYFSESFNININTLSQWKEVAAQNNYQYERLLEEETSREKKRLEKIEKLKEKFFKNPTLELKFQNMNIAFDYRIIVPIDNLGTVYPELQVTDDWGLLTVTDGALITSDWTKVIVSEPSEIKDEEVIGNGWKLKLNTGWNIVKHNKNFKITKE